MKILKEITAYWKADAKWSSQSIKGKATIVWFGVSVCVLFAACESWLIVPALINLLFASIAISKVDIEE